MQLTPLESQLLASAAFAVPAIILLVIAVLQGAFSRTEDAKYVVLLGRERDFWDTSKGGEDDETEE